MIARPAALALPMVLILASNAGAGAATTPALPDDSLILLSVDVRTLPGLASRNEEPKAPQWRTSFGSERRASSTAAKPAHGVDADIVLLQGVTDVPALRRWFPAGKWRLVVSRQLFPSGPSDDGATPPPPPPSTAIAVRLRRGLRITGQTHLTELALDRRPDAPAAAGTAVRVLIDNRETWAVSVLLPEDCPAPCPGRAALDQWHAARSSDNVRRVTGGRFEPASSGDAQACSAFGLRLDPPPPPPRPAYHAAAMTEDLGCAASVAVAK
jgi:hypothetical protein